MVQLEVWELVWIIVLQEAMAIMGKSQLLQIRVWLLVQLVGWLKHQLYYCIITVAPREKAQTGGVD